LKQSQLNTSDLRQFTGTEQWYRHALNRKVLFTDGVKYVADRAGAYWLLDEIALLQLSDKRLGAQAFQVWKLSVHTELSADLSCEDGNNNVVLTKTIPFTDFPVEGITFWFTDNTIVLPTEY
jgi:hypothetical protein